MKKVLFTLLVVSFINVNAGEARLARLREQAKEGYGKTGVARASSGQKSGGQQGFGGHQGTGAGASVPTQAQMQAAVAANPADALAAVQQAIEKLGITPGNASSANGQTVANYITGA